MPCQTCSHPQRQAIDQALLEGNHTFESLSHLYGLSISSLFRHKKHLVEKTCQARQRLRDSQAQVSLLKLNAYLDQVQRAVQTAEAQGNVNLVLKGAQIGSRLIRQIGQMEVPLGLDTVYRLISSPQWGTQDSLLPTDPNLIIAIHQSIAETALFPCPDPPSEFLPGEDEDDEYDNEADDDGEAEAAEESAIFPVTGNQKPETIPLETQTMLQELLTDLITASGTTPKRQREISAKKPENIPSCSENILQNQLYNCNEKNFGRNPGVGRESEAPPAVLMQSEAPPVQPETLVIETRDLELKTHQSPPAYSPVDDCIVPLRSSRWRSGLLQI